MQIENQALQANIWKLYALKATAGSYLFLPVVILFFQSHGLSLAEIFILQSIFALTLVLCEVPSGYISDHWGRRKTAILASFLYCASVCVYGLSSGFWSLMIGEILIALGISFYSGTLEAILYDTLLELNCEQQYRKHFGEAQFYHFSSEAVGGIFGGLLASIHLTYAVWATLIPFGIGCFLAFSLYEPTRHKPQQQAHVHQIAHICSNILLKRSETRNIVMLHAAIASMTLLLFWLTQPYQEMVGLPLTLFGVMHAIIVIAGALASRYTHTVDQYISDQHFLILIGITVVAGYLLLGSFSSLWVLPCFIAVRIAWGFLSPLTSDIMNRLTTSDIRATVLSIKSLFFRLLFAIVSPIVGYVVDILSLSQALIYTGIIGAIALLTLFIVTKDTWKQIAK